MHLLSFLLLLGILAPDNDVVGFSSGAGGCPPGVAAVGADHRLPDVEIIDRTLFAGGFQLELNNVPVRRNNPASGNFAVGVEHQLAVTGDSAFRGVLMRLQAPDNVDTSTALVPLANVEEADACIAPVVGVTHRNAGLQRAGVATLFFDEPVEDIIIDVTVVVQNNNNISEFYYTGYTISAVPAGVSPTVPPTVAPIVSTSVSPTVVDETVVEIIVADEELETLESAILASDLLGELLATEPLMVFAPADFAWDLLGSTIVDFLLRPGSILHLQEVIRFHTANLNLRSSDLEDGLAIEMRNSRVVTVSIAEGEVFLVDDLFGRVRVVDADILASNGIIHKTDRVMRPPFLFSTLLDIYRDDSVFSTLVELIAIAGLEETLTSQVLTFLAPTNDAFAALPSGRLEALRADPTTLEQVLLFHALVGLYPSENLMNNEQVVTVQGSTILITFTGDSTIEFDGAQARFSDRLASNGLAYALNAVLDLGIAITAPPTVTPSPTVGASELGSPAPSSSPFPTNGIVENSVIDIILNDPQLESFRDLLIAAGVVETFTSLQDVTIFAPTNSAFMAADQEFLARMLQPEWVAHLVDIISVHIGVLEYPSFELVNDAQISVLNTQTINVRVRRRQTSLFTENFENVTITEFDLTAPNGRVHKLDTVMTPLFVYTNLIDAYKSELFFFATFLELVVVADLESTLQEGFFTILAPINGAFRDLPNDNAESLLAPGNEEIARQVVLNHVIDGLVPSEFLFDGDKVTVMNGDTPYQILLQLNDDDTYIFRIGGADVLVFDGLAINGLGYALGSVLLPEGLVIPAAPTASPTVTAAPTSSPTATPTGTFTPTVSSPPTASPTVSPAPTASPTATPTVSPAPTASPTVSPAPTASPTITFEPTTAGSSSPELSYLFLSAVMACITTVAMSTF